MVEFVIYVGEDVGSLKKNAFYIKEKDDEYSVLLSNGLGTIGWVYKKCIRPVKQTHEEKEEEESSFDTPVTIKFPNATEIFKIKEQLALMKTYLLHKLDIEDFHGVYDCAIDMRCLHEKLQWLKEKT